jgi:hypothetical protein
MRDTMLGALEAHMKAMKSVMESFVETKELGFVLKFGVKWDGNSEFEFVIRGIFDPEIAKDPETQKSVSGNGTFLCGAPDIQCITIPCR